MWRRCPLKSSSVSRALRAIFNANLICLLCKGSCCHNHVVKTLVLSSVALQVLQMVLRCAKGDYH